MNRLLIVAILLISTVPLYAQRQQQNVAKLKGDARNLVGIIGSDKTKIQTYCQIEDLSEQLLQAVEDKDRKKAQGLTKKIAELNKKMGPEFAALIDIEKHVDLDSRDGPGNRFNSRQPRRILWGKVRVLTFVSANKSTTTTAGSGGRALATVLQIQARAMKHRSGVSWLGWGNWMRHENSGPNCCLHHAHWQHLTGERPRRRYLCLHCGKG